MSDQHQSRKIRNYDATTAKGLAFALLGCLNFGPDGKSMPTFRPEAINLIQAALDKRNAEAAAKHDSCRREVLDILSEEGWLGDSFERIEDVFAPALFNPESPPFDI